MVDDKEKVEAKEAKIDVKTPAEPKAPEEPKEAGGAKKFSPKGMGKGASKLPKIFGGIPKIFKEGPGVPEDRNEPHTHLLFLLITVIVIGGIIGALSSFGSF